MKYQKQDTTKKSCLEIFEKCYLRKLAYPLFLSRQTEYVHDITANQVQFI